MTNRVPIVRARFDGELVVDNFAGGGGASIGIEAAIGRPVDIAINHSPEAIAMHRANHPETAHYLRDIWEVDPAVACGGRPVGLAWFSPDCTHFSRAKGTAPRSKEIRGLAWVVIRWARAVRPRVICLENVEEFQTWGPLGDDGRPDLAHVGETYREWLAQLVACGYSVEYRSLVAADYGTPTTRKRLFLIARRDGAGIAWPEASHGHGRRETWRPASEVIDWTLPCPSIFKRVRPLADATLRRIATGIRRYVIDAADPFIIPLTHHGDARAHSIREPLRTVTGAHRGELALVAATILRNFGGPNGNPAPAIDPRRPLSTVTGQDHHALAAAFLTKFYGTATGANVRAPMPTITGGGGHVAEVRAFLMKYYGADGRAQQQSLLKPLHTVTTKARFGLVMVRGECYRIVDIGMRMLQPYELFAAQGFPEDYEIAPYVNGKPMTKTAQTMLAGNSVCPQVAEALVGANAVAG